MSYRAWILRVENSKFPQSKRLRPNFTITWILNFRAYWRSTQLLAGQPSKIRHELRIAERFNWLRKSAALALARSCESSIRSMFIRCRSKGISIFAVALVNCDENNIPRRCNGKSYILSAWTGFRFLRFPAYYFPARSLSLTYVHIHTHICSLFLSLFLLIQHSRGGTRCLLSSLVELELEVYAWCPSGGLGLYILSVSVLFLCLRLYYAMVHSGLSYPKYPICIRNNFTRAN